MNMTLSEKLAAVQAELKAPKGQFNGFGKYNYRSCEDILEAVKPLLAKYKALIVLNDDIVLVGDRYYIAATATFYDIESDGSIEAKAYAREDKTKKGMDEAQITGSTSSYARKYALGGLLAIDDTKDSDSTNTGDKPAAAPAPAKKTRLYCENCGNEVKAWGKYTPEKVVEINRRRYGAGLCADCSQKIKEVEEQ